MKTWDDDYQEFNRRFSEKPDLLASFFNPWGKKDHSHDKSQASRDKLLSIAPEVYHGEIKLRFSKKPDLLEANRYKKEQSACLNLFADPRWDVSIANVDEPGPSQAIHGFDPVINKNAAKGVVKYRKVAAPGIQSIVSTDRLLIQNWQKGEKLGSGSFGTVYQCYNEDGQFFAAKEVSLLNQGPKGMACISQLRKEIDFLSRLQHDNIVQYLGTGMDDEKLYIFLELLPLGSLEKHYEKYDLMDSHVARYTRQILSGLTYLHAQKVVHRDIKCANILVHQNQSVKLADFGLAKELNDVKSCKGTLRWMAPEVLNSEEKNGYGPAADIWSFGCTVLEMLTGLFPYFHLNESNAEELIRGGVPPIIPETLSAMARDFISSCLQRDPDKRPTAAELLKHPYVQPPAP